MRTCDCCSSDSQLIHFARPVDREFTTIMPTPVTRNDTTTAPTVTASVYSRVDVTGTATPVPLTLPAVAHDGDSALAWLALQHCSAAQAQTQPAADGLLDGDAAATAAFGDAVAAADLDGDGAGDSDGDRDCGAVDADADASAAPAWVMVKVSLVVPSPDSATPVKVSSVTVSRNAVVAVDVAARYGLASDVVSEPPPELPTSTYTAPEYGVRALGLTYGPVVDVDVASDAVYDVVGVVKFTSGSERWYDSDCPVMTMSTPYASW